MKIAVIKWSQRNGGMLDIAHPKMNLTDGQVNNIYSMHRMRNKLPSFATFKIKTNADQYNLCSFYSGFGEGGYGGNYGEHAIGVSERIIILFLDQRANAHNYDEICIYIASRLLIDLDGMERRVKKCVKFLDSAVGKSTNDLLKHLIANLDSKLKLSDEQVAQANLNLSKALHYHLEDYKLQIKEMRDNPMYKQISTNSQSSMKKKEHEMAELKSQIDNINQALSISQAVDMAKNDEIEQMKQDYIKIFGTLTGKINDLEAELTGIQTSTGQYVQELTQTLASKMKLIEELKEELNTIKMSN